MTEKTDSFVHDDEWIDDDALPDDDAFADDAQIADERPPRARRRSLPPVAIGLLSVVIAGLGFIGGVQVQKRSGDDAAGGLPAGMAAMAPGGGGGTAPGAAAPEGAAPGGGAPPGGVGGASSSATTGEVANVKGSRVYVTTADGSTTEVSVGSTASVQRLASSSVDEIRPGDTVVVTGTTRSDGRVKATALQATARGVSLLGGMRGMGAAPGDAGGGAAAPGSEAGGSGSDSDAATGDAVDQLFESGD
ncbi:MAG: hypothetical protein WC558_09765 [Patulibacter sp.]